MDKDQTLDNDLRPELHISFSSRQYLFEIAKWSKFLAILGFIGIGFLVILSFSIGSIMENAYGDFPVEIPFALMGMLYLAIALIYVIPMLSFYRFSTHLKQALEMNDQQFLDQAFGYLKSHFKFIAIMAIIFIAIYGLLILLGVLGALMAI